MVIIGFTCDLHFKMKSNMSYISGGLRVIMVSVLMILAYIGPVFADTVVNPHSEASRLYEKGDYAKAAEAWLAMEKADGGSASLFFNIANSYAQMGDYGRAMLYYGRARRLDPSNDEINNNLRYFASKVEDSNRAELRGKKISVVPDHETFFQTTDRLIAQDVLSDTWAEWSVAAFLLFIGCVALYLFCSNVMLRKTGFFGGITMLIVSVVFLVFAFMAASYSKSRDRGVLMTYKTELLVEPSPDSKPATTQLCQGTCFDIIAEETDVQGVPTWYKVRLNANFEGWLRASDIEII